MTKRMKAVSVLQKAMKQFVESERNFRMNSDKNPSVTEKLKREMEKAWMELSEAGAKIWNMD